MNARGEGAGDAVFDARERAILHALGEVALPGGAILASPGEATYRRMERFFATGAASVAQGYRALLWSREEAREACGRILPYVNLLVATEGDMELLLGERLSRDEALRALVQRYPVDAAAMTCGGEGSIGLEPLAIPRDLAYGEPLLPHRQRRMAIALCIERADSLASGIRADPVAIGVAVVEGRRQPDRGRVCRQVSRRARARGHSAPAPCGWRCPS